MLSETQRANMCEMTLIALLAASLGVVSEADGLVIGGAGRALPLRSCLAFALALVILALALVGPGLPGL